MARRQTGAISFGLVHIPVELYSATQDNDIHFNQLYKEDLSRIRYKKMASSTGAEVKEGDIVRGYQYEKNRYVVITDEELEKVKTEQDRSIRIRQFTELDSIPVIYYDKAFYVLPVSGGEKAFELLRQAMQDERKVAIGSTVLGSRETILALLPAGEGLLMRTLFYADEIKAVPKEVSAPAPTSDELAMAKQLIGAMERPFDPAAFHDDYQLRLKQMIEDKIEGREIRGQEGHQGAQIINLMDALRASLEQTEPPKAAPRKRKAV